MKINNSDLKIWEKEVDAYLVSHAEANDPFKKYFDTPAFLSLLGKVRGKKVLDIGCGNGDLCKRLHRRGARVTGLDGSSSMIEAAQENFDKCPYVICDLLRETIPFRTNSFDIVTAKMVLDIVASVEKVSQQAYRVLKRKGLYAIEVPYPIRPILKSKKHRYIGISDYHEQIHGIIKFSDTDFSYYHRPTSYYINEIISCGFTLCRMQEVSVNDDFVREFPDEMDKRIIPTSLQLLFQKL